MHTLLTNVKELFDLFGCVTLYQKAYLDALHKAHEAADALGNEKSNTRTMVAYRRAQRCQAQYEKANAEYIEAREAVYLALGI